MKTCSNFNIAHRFGWNEAKHHIKRFIRDIQREDLQTSIIKTMFLFSFLIKAYTFGVLIVNLIIFEILLAFLF